MGKAAQLLIATNSPSAVIRITGKANFQISVKFKSLVTQLIERGFDNITLDITECTLMDSTFIGVMAGLSQSFKRGSTTSPSSSLKLYGISDRIQSILEGLGILSFFPTTNTLEGIEGSDYNQSSDDSEATKKQLTANSLDAHETLMALNEANVAKFEEVTEFLRRELDSSD